MSKASVERVASASPDILAEQRDALRELFPQAFAEGRIDFDKLRASLGDLVDDRPERYTFSWAGKIDAIRALQAPSQATLVPARDESVNFDTTQHLFIEGDNLEVLKLLYKPYFGRVKMIYIDPPYNTGNEFVYSDDFRQPLDAYLRQTGQRDDAGNLLTTNKESSGRYHSDWLSMMYPRLFLARQLLREDGVIFVSIDDHEVHHLRLLMNEVFGEENFVATFIWQKRTTRENRKVFSFNHDYIVCFARSSDQFQAIRNLLPFSEEVMNRYSNPDNDPRGLWQSVSLNAQAGPGRRQSQFYEVLTPGGRVVEAPAGRCWIVTKDRMDELIADGRVWFGADGNNVPRQKVFLSEAREGLTPHTLWVADEVGTTDSAKKAMIELFDGVGVFDTPKPVELLERMIHIGSSGSSEDIVLDFFAGSSGTAEAVLALNQRDGSNRRFMMVQLPEPTDDRSTANKAGYANIADIGKERIRRVIAKLQSESDGKLPLDTREMPEDLGFRVFKLAASHWQVWREPAADASTGEYRQALALFHDPLVGDWQAEDVIHEVILREGFSLTARIEVVEGLPGPTVWKVNDDDKEQTFYLCLDPGLTLETTNALGLTQDDLFICRDVALDDTEAANLALQCRLKAI